MPEDVSNDQLAFRLSRVGLKTITLPTATQVQALALARFEAKLLAGRCWRGARKAAKAARRLRRAKIAAQVREITIMHTPTLSKENPPYRVTGANGTVTLALFEQVRFAWRPLRYDRRGEPLAWGWVCVEGPIPW